MTTSTAPTPDAPPGAERPIVASCAPARRPRALGAWGGLGLLLSALATSGCATSWSGRYAPVDGSWDVAQVVTSVVLRLEEDGSGAVTGELRSGPARLSLSLAPVVNADDVLYQDLTVPAPFTLPLQDLVGARDPAVAPPVVREDARVDPGAYQVQVRRSQRGLVLMLLATPEPVSAPDAPGVSWQPVVVFARLDGSSAR